MAPFKHEFYALAIKISGGGTVKLGSFDATAEQDLIFFNSPYQILSWDIPPDWKGYYVIFSEDFYRNNIRSEKRITDRFPFLLIDNTLPIEIDEDDKALFVKIFQDVAFEFGLNDRASKEIIAHYVHILLSKTNRLYLRQKGELSPSLTERAKDVEIVNRFKSLLDVSFRPGKEYSISSPHQVQFYADKLHLHPSHFNAIIKRITDAPASEHIQDHIFSLAKNLLTNTSDSVKEIAYTLYYSYPNHFASFFKKKAKMTPSQFRKIR